MVRIAIAGLCCAIDSIQSTAALAICLFAYQFAAFILCINNFENFISHVRYRSFIRAAPSATAWMRCIRFKYPNVFN